MSRCDDLRHLFPSFEGRLDKGSVFLDVEQFGSSGYHDEPSPDDNNDSLDAHDEKDIQELDGMKPSNRNVGDIKGKCIQIICTNTPLHTFIRI